MDNLIIVCIIVTHLLQECCAALDYCANEKATEQHRHQVSSNSVGFHEMQASYIVVDGTRVGLMQSILMRAYVVYVMLWQGGYCLIQTTCTDREYFSLKFRLG